MGRGSKPAPIGSWPVKLAKQHIVELLRKLLIIPVPVVV